MKSPTEKKAEIYYSDLRSLECFKKGLKKICQQESEISKQCKNKLYTFCLFLGKLSKENCVQCIFLRILFAAIKQRAIAYFAERHDALGFLGGKDL